MTTGTKTGSDGSCCAQGAQGVLPRWLAGSRMPWVLGGAAIVAGMAFNWGWFVAIGIAPLLIAVLPCLAMCALGLCMNRKKESAAAPDAKTDAPALPAPPVSLQPAVAEAIAARPIAAQRPMANAAARSESERAA